MLFGGILTSFALSLLSLSFACSPQTDSRCQGPKQLIVGSDGPADPATIGYSINHMALLVNDLDASQRFYADVLGMRHIFTWEISPQASVTYMGHAQGGKNGTGFMDGCELFTEKDNLQGLIELFYVKDSNETKFPSTQQVRNTFSHIGLIVPDTTVFQQRMDSLGVKVVKRIGQTDLPFPGPLASIFGISSQKLAISTFKGIEPLGFDQFVFIEDPDGNLLEVQPQI